MYDNTPPPHNHSYLEGRYRKTTYIQKFKTSLGNILRPTALKRKLYSDTSVSYKPHTHFKMS